MLDAFELQGRVLHGRYRPELRAEALGELAVLWARHADEIRAAAAPEAPWLLAILADTNPEEEEIP